MRRQRTESSGARKSLRAMLSQRRLEYPLRHRVVRMEDCLAGRMESQTLVAIHCLAKIAETWYNTVKFGRRRRYTVDTVAAVTGFFAEMRRCAADLLTAVPASSPLAGSERERFAARYLELAERARGVRETMDSEGSVTIRLTAGDMETLRTILARNADMVPEGSGLARYLT